MAKGDDHSPELVRAAQAVESEIVTLEERSRSVRKIRLHSDKSIARAVKELNEALEMPDRIGEGLRGLVAAMERMQARQQAALEPLAACAASIQQRAQQLGQHMEAFARLGKAAGDVATLIQVEGGDHASVLDQVEAKLTSITEEARSVFEAARSDDFPEVAREADALKQRILALRGRLKRNGQRLG